MTDTPVAPVPQAVAQPQPEPAGAMVPPGSELAPRSPLEQIDTTVEIAELRAIRSWRKRTRIGGNGRVLLALHADRDEVLRLSIVEDNTGAVAQFPITGAVLSPYANDTADGHTFPPRNRGEGDAGPIVFAIRVRHGEGIEPSEQVVVFSEGASLRVATRLLTATTWTARYRLDFPRGTKFVGIGTTFPH